MDNIKETEELDAFDKLAEKELGKVAFQTWSLIWENSHLEKTRDWMLVLQLIETFEEYKYLRNKLKPKRKTESNPNPKDPRIHENSNGTIQTHPYKAQLKDAQNDLRRIIADLGLSPISAASLKSLNEKELETIKNLIASPERIKEEEEMKDVLYR